MRPNLKSIIVLLLLYNVIIIMVISVSGQELQSDPFATLSEGDRDKRALDLGWLVRNILMKSAYASNTKAAVSRNLINAKLTKTTTTTTTPRPTRRRPAPATLPPFFANKKSFLFPFDFSASSGAFQPINKFGNVQGNPAAAAVGGGSGGIRGGYMNFDYDYVDPPKLVAPVRRRRPTTTTAAPTTTATTTTEPAPPPPPPPPAALPPRRRPFGGYGGRQKFLNYDYYDDYDYAESEPTTPAPPPPPSRRPRPRQRRPPQQNQISGTVAPPSRTGARQDRPARLRNPFIYQYAQNNDISTNNGNAVQTADSAPATAGNTNTQPPNANANDDATAADDNDDDDIASPQDTNEQNNQDVSSDDYDLGTDAAFDPSNVEDNNDSSDTANSNVNTNGNGNGNGSNNDDTQRNTGNNNNGPTNQSPLINFDNNPGGPPLSSSASGQFADFPNGNGQVQGQGTTASRPFGALFSGYQNFQFPSFNSFDTQYQQPSSPVGYSVRYY